MNKTELIEKVSGITGMSKAASGRALEAILTTISNSLKKNVRVSLIGFGSFVVRKRAPRTGINPKTKMPVHIKAAKVPAFRAGRKLRENIN